MLTHAESILAKAPGVLPIAADLSCPDEILYDWRVRQHLDFYRPMCLILAMTLHFFDADTARTLIAQYVAGLPYGSYLIVSVGQLEGEMGAQFSKQYSAGRLHHHNRETVTSFLEGLQLAGPGVTEARAWRAPALIPTTDGEAISGRPWAGRRAAPDDAAVDAWSCSASTGATPSCFPTPVTGGWRCDGTNATS